MEDHENTRAHDDGQRGGLSELVHRAAPIAAAVGGMLVTGAARVIRARNEELTELLEELRGQLDRAGEAVQEAHEAGYSLAWRDYAEGRPHRYDEARAAAAAAAAAAMRDGLVDEHQGAEHAAADVAAEA